MIRKVAVRETRSAAKARPSATRDLPIRFSYFVLSFCLATRRCMNLGPSFL